VEDELYHSTTAWRTGEKCSHCLIYDPFLALVRDNQSQCRHGKAPPIDEFSEGESQVNFDDWLPILERAATVNGWTQEETLMQLVRHLRGRALQEWKLLNPTDKTTYYSTIKALRERLDPGKQNLSLLDLCHRDLC